MIHGPARALATLCALMMVSASAMADAPVNQTHSGESLRVPIPAEGAKTRAALPLFKVIPAADDSELTPTASEDYLLQNTWARSNANSANTRYSPLSQINRNTVAALEVAWIYHSNDGKGNIEANPVIVDGVIYAPTVGGHIVAINGTTGAEIWRALPLAPTPASQVSDSNAGDTSTSSPSGSATPESPNTGFGPAQRGLVYWPGDPIHSPRLYFMANGFLVALDAKTGKRVAGFGEHGLAGSTKGSGNSSFLGTPAPVVYRDVIIAANQNLVDAFDVVTGSPLWHFDTLTYPVDAPDMDNGGNIWGGTALDEVRGVAYFAIGDPHPNFVGVNRAGPNKHTCSLIALDALTGRLMWSFQEVAHNLWDLDVPAPPNLVTLWHHGKRVDAVAQVTKLGNTLLLDRLSGKPLFPFRLRRAPVSTVPGEYTSPYQPDLQLPQPFARQVFTLSDVADITPESHAFILDKVRKATFGWFEPPHVGQPIVFFGVHGGAEWTGASFDPATGWLYVSANELAWIESLSVRTPRHRRQQPQSSGEMVYLQHCAVCHGETRQGRGMMPSLANLAQRLTDSQVSAILKTGRNSMPPIALTDRERYDLLDSLFGRDVVSTVDAPPKRTDPPSYEASGFDKLLDADGYPGSKPPWGTLNAIDLNTGKLVWKVPLGEYEELTRQHIPETGTENFGGAMVTGGGLVFCAGTRDLNIRAFDKTTGAELWRHSLPFGGYAPPATYSAGGRQYIVIAATGGGKLGGEMGDAYVAFALPKSAMDTQHN